MKKLILALVLISVTQSYAADCPSVMDRIDYWQTMARGDIQRMVQGLRDDGLVYKVCRSSRTFHTVCVMCGDKKYINVLVNPSTGYVSFHRAYKTCDCDD